MEVLLIANDNLIQVVGLQDVATGSYVNTATLTGVLKLNGTPVAGATSIPIQYVAASNGNYNGLLEDTVALVEGQKYMLEISGSGGGITAKWEIECVARVRRK